MTAATLTLTDFLLARIAEDEWVAQRAHDNWPGPWRVERGEVLHSGTNGAYDRPYVTNCDGLFADEHVALHDPARALAECEAKRRIVEFHKSWPVLVETPPTLEQDGSFDPTKMSFRMSQQIAWTTEQQYREHFGSEPPTAPMMLALAAVYADHPDYRDEWRPAP